MLNHILTFIIFLLIGIELRSGIQHLKSAVIPVIAAIGGMLFPFLIFSVLQPNSQLWATVMPTDVVLALAVLAIIGKKAKPGVRLFLLTLAVADDFFTLIIMGVFYRSDLHAIDALSTLGAAACGALIPFGKTFVKTLIPLNNFLIIPLYIFTNLFIGLNLQPETFEISSAVITSRVFGKVIGISLVVLLAIKVLKVELSDDLTMHDIIGIGFLGGMGMAVSLVIADIATQSELLLNQVRVGLFISAFLSALLAMTWFRFLPASVFFSDHIRNSQRNQ